MCYARGYLCVLRCSKLISSNNGTNIICRRSHFLRQGRLLTLSSTVYLQKGSTLHSSSDFGRTTEQNVRVFERRLQSAKREKKAYEAEIGKLEEELTRARQMSPGAPGDKPQPEEKKRLVQVVKSSKKSTSPRRTLDRTKKVKLIEKNEAMRAYFLEASDLVDLPYTTRRSEYLGEPLVILILESDVVHKAYEKHGSEDALQKIRSTRPGWVKTPTPPTFESKERRQGSNVGLSSGSGRVVVFAMGMNVCDALVKGFGWWMTGSKSLFAEMIHSCFDAVNQLSLAVGLHLASRKPDETHPYGYAGLRYMTSGVSGLIMLAVGGGMNIFHGVHALWHHSPLDPLSYAYPSLVLSLCFQAMSLTRAFLEVRRKASHINVHWLTYLKTVSASDPSLAVILMEDTASMIGVICALTMITVSDLMQSPMYDAFGSIMIGALLFGVANFIVKRNAEYLIGRAMPFSERSDIVSLLEKDPVVRFLFIIGLGYKIIFTYNTMFSSVHDVKSTVLGPDQCRFKAEIDFNGRNITKSYLEQQNLDALLREVKSFKSKEEFRSFMLHHGAAIIDRQGDEVDRIEKMVKDKHPTIRHVDLEAL